MRRLRLGLALTLACGTAANTTLPAFQSQASITGLIAAYADLVQGRTASVDLTVIDLDAARQDLARLDPALLPTPSGATPEIARETQRRLITSFALEVAAVGSRRHQSAAARLIEW